MTISKKNSVSQGDSLKTSSQNKMKTVEPKIDISPKGVIFLTLGGYQAGAGAKEQAEKTAAEFCRYMKRYDLSIEVRNDELVFMKKTESH